MHKLMITVLLSFLYMAPVYSDVKPTPLERGSTIVVSDVVTRKGKEKSSFEVYVLAERHLGDSLLIVDITTLNSLDKNKFYFRLKRNRKDVVAENYLEFIDNKIHLNIPDLKPDDEITLAIAHYPRPDKKMQADIIFQSEGAPPRKLGWFDPSYRNP